MKYLSAVRPPAPAPYKNYVWVSERANATQFSSLAEAEAAKSAAPDAEAIIGGSDSASENLVVA